MAANSLTVKAEQTDNPSRCMNQQGYHFSYADFYVQGANKSLARPGWKQATATEDFYVRISYLLS